jgi:hypothetical protein
MERLRSPNDPNALLGTSGSSRKGDMVGIETDGGIGSIEADSEREGPIGNRRALILAVGCCEIVQEEARDG